MLIGTYSGTEMFAGLELKVERWDGKGRTVLRASGALAQELVKSVADHIAAKCLDGRHVRSVDPSDGKYDVSVAVYGRKRQTVAAISEALQDYSFKVATANLGTPIPMIRIAPPPELYADAAMETAS